MLILAIRCVILLSIFAVTPAALAQTSQIPLIERGLELNTPEKAVDTFLALHRAGDFESLWFVLDPALRKSFLAVIQQAKAEIFTGPKGDPKAIMDKAWTLMAEHSADPANSDVVDVYPYFSAILAAARQLKIDAFDFSGALAPVSRSEKPSPSGPLQVFTFRSDASGQVAFELRQAPSKRWRVYGVAANIGTDKEFRWASER